MVMLDNFYCWFFFKVNLAKHLLRNTIRESNNLDPIQSPQNVGYDMHTLLRFFTVILTIKNLTNKILA